MLDQSNLKDYADYKINLTYLTNFDLGRVENPLEKGENSDFDLGRVENIVGKGENAGYQHFLLYPQCFQKASLSGLLKVGIVW